MNCRKPHSIYYWHIDSILVCYLNYSIQILSHYENTSFYHNRMFKQCLQAVQLVGNGGEGLGHLVFQFCLVVHGDVESHLAEQFTFSLAVGELHIVERHGIGASGHV